MKLALNIQNGSLAGKVVEMNGGFLTVGRGAACNVKFDPAGERAVSTNHAYIENKPDGFYLIDHDSTNGTFVNGEKIKRVRLNDRDAIQFGKNGPEAIVSIVGAAHPNQPNAARPNQADFVSQGAPNNQQFQFQPIQPIQPVQQDNWRNMTASIGVGNPQIKPESSQTRKYVGIAAVLFAVVFFGLIVTQMMVTNLGIVPAFIAAIIAFVPATLYILPLVFLDRYDPEPPWALALAFAWGALVAVIFSANVNGLFGAIATDLLGPGAGRFATAVISAPIFEEGSKGLGVVLFLIFLRKEFDDILDGIVYAGVIALGFATVENVLYYGSILLTGNLLMLFVVFVVRGIFSPFAHVTFTAMTGIGCGISRESHNKAVKFLAPVGGYLVAVLLHAMWNGVIAGGGLEDFFVRYVIYEVPFFFIFVGFAGYIMNRQNKILKEMLAIDVARGLISQAQLETVTSVFKSSFWLLSSVFTAKYKARRRFLRAVGKLGLSYWHIQRATAAQGQTASFQQNPILRQEVINWRDKI